MKLCTGSVLDSNGLGGTESALVVQVVIDGTWSFYGNTGKYFVVLGQ